MLTTIPTCDFCRSNLPEQYYRPRNSKRGMHVFVCTRCGLMQSQSTKRYPSRPLPSMSCDADRASIKYTKDLVLKPHWELLTSRLDLPAVKNILDVGSNRGAFLKKVLQMNPLIKATAIETDPDLMKVYMMHPQVFALNQRFESADLQPNNHDLVYCAHTLEHFSSASSMIFKLWSVLKPGGFLFIAVPNTLTLSEDTFEEVFVDTHTFHFHDAMLETFFKNHKMEIVFKSPPGSFELDYLLHKPSKHIPQFLPQLLFSEQNVQMSLDFMDNYENTLTRNRKKIERASSRINALPETSKIVFWGAGRIFDGLVKLGGLNTKRIALLVDKYLYPYMPGVHGVAIKAPEALVDFSSDTTLVVASREYESEITAEAREMGFSNIMGYSQLMSA
jgi:2-polyprenyl-3-methyl-5-hydroxy-6-metoxy-1,4-benzoquinol methylase